MPQVSADITASSITTADAGDMPPTKKMKASASPFDWFQCAPDRAVITSAIVTRASVEPLKERVLCEIRKYENEPSPSHIAAAVFDPLLWWGEREGSYPLLSNVARILFVITASSAECEQHFSAFNARHIITAQRNLMFPETVEVLSIVLEGYKNKLC